VLIKSILCGNGKLQLTRNALHEAVTQRLIPVSTTFNDEETVGELDLAPIEPTSYKMISRFLLNRLRESTWLNYYLQLIAELIRDEKGKVAEEVLAYYISLSVLSSPSSSLSLFDLLKPFYPYDEKNISGYWKTAHSISCTATKVVNVKSLKKNERKLDLDLLVEKENSYYTDRVFFNPDESMGLDLCFVGTGSNCKPKLITVQCKNLSKWWI
jgi:hypothetical protein